MADTDIKIKLTADPKPVRDAIKLIDRDLKELGDTPILNDEQLPNTDEHTIDNSQSDSSERLNQNRRDRTNTLILRELVALRRELQKSNQLRSNPPEPSSSDSTTSTTDATPPPPGPTPPPSPGDNTGGGSSDSANNGAAAISAAISKLGALWSLGQTINQWANSSQSRESLAYKTYGSLLTYDDYNIAGREANLIGRDTGYGYEEVMAAQRANMQSGGFANMESLQDDSRALLKSSKAWGIDPTQVAAASGRMTGFGTFRLGEQQKFAKMLAQSIQEHGMQGREDQELRVLQNISENLATRNTTLTEDTFRSGLNLYGALATINPNLSGERGGNLAEKMVNTAAQDDRALDIMAGLGTKYTGIEGQLELWRKKETDPQGYWTDVWQGMQDSFQGVEPGRLEDMFKFKMHHTGYSVQESEDMLKAIQSGGTFDLSKNTAAAEEAEQKRTENYQNSDLGRMELFDSDLKAAKDEIGAILNDIKVTFLDIFTGMSQGGQMGTTLAATAIPVLGGGFIMSKLGGLLGGLGAGASGAGAGTGGILSSLFSGINATNTPSILSKAKVGGSVLAGGIAAYDVYQNASQGNYKEATGSAVGGAGAIGGGLLGAKGGAIAGAAIGGPVGAVIGGVLGGIGGSLLGGVAGKGAGEGVYDLVNGSPTNTTLPEETRQRESIEQKRDDREYDRQKRDDARLTEQLQKDTPTETAVLGARMVRDDAPYRAREFTPQDQAKLIQQTGTTPTTPVTTAYTPITSQLKPQGETLFAANKAVADDSRFTPIQRDEDSDESNQESVERQLRLMENDTRATAENTLAITENTKALEKNNKDSLIQRILNRFKGGTASAATTRTGGGGGGSFDSASASTASQSKPKTIGDAVKQQSQSSGNRTAPDYKSKFVDTGNPLDDYSTFMSDVAKEKYGKDVPTAFWRTILRQETGTNNSELSFYKNNPGGMDYSDWMAEYGAHGEEIVDNGGYRHTIANFDDPIQGAMAEVDYFCNPEAHDFAKQEIELASQGRLEDAFKIHEERYVGTGTAWEDSGYRQVLQEELERGENIRTGDDQRTPIVQQQPAQQQSALNVPKSVVTPKTAPQAGVTPIPKTGGVTTKVVPQVAPVAPIPSFNPISHATGKEYVPYDNYPALLHKGERVLTKLEANELRDIPGVSLPPELQIDENKDTIQDRKYKRAAQEQYQYNTSHTQTNLSTELFQTDISDTINTSTSNLTNLFNETASSASFVTTSDENSTNYDVDTHTENNQSRIWEQAFNRVNGLKISLQQIASKTPQQMAIGGSPSSDVPVFLHKGEMVLSRSEDVSWQAPISAAIGTKVSDSYTPPRKTEAPLQLAIGGLIGNVAQPAITSSILPTNKSDTLPGVLKPYSVPNIVTDEISKQTPPELKLLMNLTKDMGVSKADSKLPQIFQEITNLDKVSETIFSSSSNLNLPSPIDTIVKPQEEISQPVATPRRQSGLGQILNKLISSQSLWSKLLGKKQNPILQTITKNLQPLLKVFGLSGKSAPFKLTSPGLPTSVPKTDSIPNLGTFSKPAAKISPLQQISNLGTSIINNLDGDTTSSSSTSASTTISNLFKTLGGSTSSSIQQIFNQTSSPFKLTSPGLPTSVPKTDSIPNLGTNTPIPALQDNPLQSVFSSTPPPVPQMAQTVDTSSEGMNASSIDVNLTVKVEGKIDGMNEANQGMVATALVQRFKQPDWLNFASKGYTRINNQ